MADFVPSLEGEKHLVIAAQHILRALGANQNLNDDLKRILVDLDTHLSAMVVFSQNNGDEFLEVEKKLKCAEQKISYWNSNQSMIWDSGPMEACEYLKAVDEVQRLVEGLKALSVNEGGQKRKELLYHADSVLQTAMSRLEMELIHILVQHKQYFEPDQVPNRSSGDGVVYDASFVSVDDNLVEATSQSDAISTESEEHLVHLVHPHVIPHLKSIAHIMFNLNYIQEFCQAFVRARKDALDEYLFILEMEKYGIEDLLKMEWDPWNKNIKKWIRAVKIVIRVYLTSEKRLCNHILEGLDSANNEFCFVEISKASLLHLLNFGQAVVMGPRRPEKLFRLLDMYEVLTDILSDIDDLFLEKTGSFIKAKFHELLWRLGDSAKATFLQFGDAIASDTTISPFPGGGIHHLTRYVMNYIQTLTIYRHTLNFLLEDKDEDDTNPMDCHFQLITSTLISNLHNKSKLYKDDALQHIFLMNNIHYMVQKVKESDLKFFFQNEWIRKHTGMFRQHATIYERATWSSVLSLLKVDGNTGGANSICKTSLKGRCRAFTIAFEEVYKRQTGWSIPDVPLREELQISTSQKVIHAYQTFLGRNSLHMHEKYTKYTVDDLGTHILDLFKGSPKSLHKSTTDMKFQWH